MIWRSGFPKCAPDQSTVETCDDIRWAKVNAEPYEYAIQQGPHGDEFVKLMNGKYLRRSTLSRPECWPAGCHDPDSCARHKACMYVKCRHEGRSIAGEVESAEAALAHPSHQDK